MTRFGLWLQLEFFTVSEALSVACLAENLGFHAVLVNDHFMKQSSKYESSNEIPEAYVTLTAIACHTQRLKIGTAVTPIPLRSAPQLAKTIATLDVLSEGRFIFGVGAGWFQAEFEGYGAHFLSPGERISNMIEGLTLMKRMWTEDEVTFEGSYHHVRGAVLLPKPVQKPYPPILIGSRSPRMCKLVARIGDGWIPCHLPPEDYEKQMREILVQARRRGRKRNDFTFACALRLIIAENKEDFLKSVAEPLRPFYRGFVLGSPEECAEQLQKYVDIGVDLILLRLHYTQRIQEQIAILHQRILPRVN